MGNYTFTTYYYCKNSFKLRKDTFCQLKGIVNVLVKQELAT